MMESNYWRKCGSCKKEIGFNTIYQACSVSSCRKMVFCSVDCWDLHNPVMNHKSSWAEERRSPKKGEENSEEGRRVRMISSPKTQVEQNHEILIVASKLKQFIKDKYDMNTSSNVMDILSSKVRDLTGSAVEKARMEGRKTVMDRDYE
ncbi:MAG: hypothetical protein ACHQYQ_07320 [Bacteriovoracales bacterium]